MYDYPSQRYGNCALVRQSFRGLAQDYSAEQLHVVMVNLSTCKTGADKFDTVPTIRLLLDGREAGPIWTIRGELLRAQVMGQIGIPAVTSDTAQYHSADLRHRFRLAIWNKHGELGVRHVAKFLTCTLAWFKKANAKPTSNVVRTPFCDMARQGNKNLGVFALSWQEQNEQTEALGIEALDEAYVAAVLVQRMLNDLPAWQRTAMKEGGYLREVVDSLRHPGGELRAWSGLIRNGNVPRADSDNFKR
jgi:hypothetical protein